MSGGWRREAESAAPHSGSFNSASASAGCCLAFGSALLTCLMLFINGSLVLAVLTAIARTGPAWSSKPEFLQFMLFFVPVLLVVAEWMMIDYVRTRLSQRRTE